MLDGIDNLAGYSLGLEHHGVMERAAEQSCIDKAWTDIGKPYIEAAGMGLLLEGLKIDVLHGLGG